MRWFVMMMAVVGLVGASFAPTLAQEDTLNQVEDWCEQGVKFDDLSGLSFRVPDPPEGATWVLLVIKAGQQSVEFVNPIPGGSYGTISGKEISHIILCYSENGGTPSTTSSTTTSSTSTLAEFTTTTAPTTTTSSSVPNSTSTTTTDSTSTTIVITPTSSTVLPTTTTHIDPPPSTQTIPPTTETPEGGVSAGGGAMAGGSDWTGAVLMAGGVLALVLSGLTWWRSRGR